MFDVRCVVWRAVYETCTLRIMIERQTVTSRAVRQYMDREGLSVRAMAERLDMRPATFHNRLRLRRRWTPEDLDRLAALGVDLPAFGEVSA